MYTRRTNAPESAGLSQDDVAVFEAARNAGVTLTKTFEVWLTLARGVELARVKADTIGRRNAFQLILEQQGLAPFLGSTWNAQKSTASKLLQILEHLPEVTAWRETLDHHHKILWAAPTTIFKHCPVFKTAETPKPSPTGSVKARAAEENQRLRQELNDAVAHIDQVKARCQELEEENESLAQKLRDATPGFTAAAAPAPTWHDLITQAIALLRAMPEDERHDAMDQWSSLVAMSVQFPAPTGKGKRATRAKPAKPAKTAAKGKKSS